MSWSLSVCAIPFLHSRTWGGFRISLVVVSCMLGPRVASSFTLFLAAAQERARRVWLGHDTGTRQGVARLV